MTFRNEDDLESVIDRIYEAAAVPEYWPQVLERIAAIADAHAASLIAMGADGVTRYIATPSYEPCFSDYATNGAHLPNLRLPRALELAPMAFVHDLEVCTQAELDADPIYTRFAQPHGLGWTAGTVVPVPSGDMLVYDMAKTLRQGPFNRAEMERLDPLRPHLARAALLAQRLQLKAAAAATQALEIVGLPAAVLRRDRTVLAANAAMLSLSPRVAIGSFDRIRLQDAMPDALFGATISGPVTDSIQSIPLAATEEGPAMVAHLLPIRRSAGDIFATADLLLIVTLVTTPDAPLTAVLTGLFDLTPAEAKIARGIAVGRTVEELAVANGVSPFTTRNQLRAVMMKTGTTRQTELALLLSGLRPLPASEAAE